MASIHAAIEVKRSEISEIQKVITGLEEREKRVLVLREDAGKSGWETLTGHYLRETEALEKHIGNQKKQLSQMNAQLEVFFDAVKQRPRLLSYIRSTEKKIKDIQTELENLDQELKTEKEAIANGKKDKDKELVTKGEAESKKIHARMQNCKKDLVEAQNTLKGVKATLAEFRKTWENEAKETDSMDGLRPWRRRISSLNSSSHGDKSQMVKFIDHKSVQSEIKNKRTELTALVDRLNKIEIEIVVKCNKAEEAKKSGDLGMINGYLDNVQKLRKTEQYCEEMSIKLHNEIDGLEQALLNEMSADRLRDFSRVLTGFWHN